MAGGAGLTTSGVLDTSQTLTLTNPGTGLIVNGTIKTLTVKERYKLAKKQLLGK